jgi:hypothetical protein
MPPIPVTFKEGAHAVDVYDVAVRSAAQQCLQPIAKITTHPLIERNHESLFAGKVKSGR